HLHGFGPPGPEIYSLNSSGIGFLQKNPYTNCKEQNMNQENRFHSQHDLTELLKQQQQQQENINLFGFGQQQQQQQLAFIRNSRYLGLAQELLTEFCHLGSAQKIPKDGDEWKESENAVERQLLYSLNMLELQRRKIKLLEMLEEVEKRYKHYCDQMRAVTLSFESVAGRGAARAYLGLASKAMSRHFRCLKDGILSHIKATKKAMGEKDSLAPGTVKGETPRLRILDQTLRKQKALQQMSSIEFQPWRPQRGLPERSVSVLRAWLFEHFFHPYPGDVDKHILARQTGLSRSQAKSLCLFPLIILLKKKKKIIMVEVIFNFFFSCRHQVSNWFINARVRLWKPMVEEIYLEELKEGPPTNNNPPRPNNRKPTGDQMGRVDPESILPVTNRPNDAGFLQCSTHGRVSLTLGLHQHGAGVDLRFCPPSEGSLIYGKQGMEECQTSVQYTSPYPNLMGEQLLHDLAG
ncbi:homeobox protein BEL1 homolog, partial [Striga asiatica]